MRTGPLKSTDTPSAEIAARCGSTDGKLGICAESTTEIPRFNENQILPSASATTDRHRFTPSEPRRPSANPYRCTSPLAKVPSSSRLRLTWTTCADVAIQSVPVRSAATPAIISCRDGGSCIGTETRPLPRYAKPASEPIHSTPAESSVRQSIDAEGKPSWTP